MNVILASQSPRRKELLAAMGVDFEVVISSYQEKLDHSRPPEEVAVELALGKALEVADRYPDSIVIGSDTIVTVDGEQLEKPRDAEEAYAMLRKLAGKPNDVTTGVAVIQKSGGVQLTGADTARVYFKPFDHDAVAAYVATGDALDKAGAYGVQSGAARLISHIEGQYDTVIGLPTHLVAEILAQFGVLAVAVELEPPVRQVLGT